MLWVKETGGPVVSRRLGGWPEGDAGGSGFWRWGERPPAPQMKNREMLGVGPGRPLRCYGAKGRDLGSAPQLGGGRAPPGRASVRKSVSGKTLKPAS
jgi:hypothetical protein